MPDRRRRCAVAALAVGVTLVLGACGTSRPPSRGALEPVAELPPIGALGGSSLALTRTGEVYAWGPHGTAQVGDAEVENCGTWTNREPCQPTPHRIAMPVPATAVSAGGDHSLARSADGTVWTWGADHVPGLGVPQEGCERAWSSARYGGRPPRCHRFPVPVQGLPPVTTISAGDKTDAALDADGRVWTWGAVIDGPDTCAGGVGPNEGAFACSARPRPVAGLPPIAAVTAAPTGQVVALDTAGGVWWWGTGYPGPYPIGTTEFAAPRRMGIPVAVAGIAGNPGSTAATVVAAGRDGSVWVWGQPYHEVPQHPVPSCRPAVCVTTPVRSLPPGTVTGLVPGGSLRARATDGTQLSFGLLPSQGFGWVPEPTVPGAIAVTSSVDEVAWSPSVTVLTEDGRVLARGENSAGELGPS